MSFFISLSGLKAAQTGLEVSSNNLANVASTGFKRSRASFVDIFANLPSQSSNSTVGLGASVQQVQQNFSQGNLETTSRTLDMGISGDGMFVLRDPATPGTLTYSRNGEFAMDFDRNIVSASGQRVQVLPVDANGVATATDVGSLIDLNVPVASPTDPDSTLVGLSIGIDGVVSADYSDGSLIPLGQIALADFPAKEQLQQLGNSQWRESRDSGPPMIGAPSAGAFGEVRSGTLERSNVDITEELVGLITAQRNFQANAKALETAGNISQSIFQIV